MIDLARIDLFELIERDGAILRGGSEKFGACPKCDGNDRFHVRSYKGRGYFFCRQCHEKRGDAIEYMRWLHGMSYGEALAALGLRGHSPTPPARRMVKPKPMTAAGVVIPDALDEPPASEWQRLAWAFVDDCAARLWTPAAARALDYLRNRRGLSDDTIKRFSLGVNPKGRELADGVYARRGYTIPYEYAGELWRVRIRKFETDSIDTDKYKVVSGAGSDKTVLFNADATVTAQTVIVCGGEFDAMLLQQHAPAGVAVVTLGSETINVRWEYEFLLRGKRVLIAYDNDKAGDDGAAKWAALGERIRVPRGKDVTEFAQAGGDVAAWLAGIALPASNAAELPVNMAEEHLILEYLQRVGYEPGYGEDGRIVAARPTLTAKEE